MKYLAIDTSGKALAAVVKNGEKEFKFYDAECGVRHSVSLMPAIENLLEQAGLTVKGLDFIAAVVGAGSFTGIRIGVATAKALCFVNGIPCLKITSFDCLAYNKRGGKTLAVINAGHNGFYVCGYENFNVVLQPSYMMKEELTEVAKEYTVISDGDIPDINTETGNSLTGLISAVDAKSGLADFNLESLEPLYVRKSQAEEGR